MAELPLDRYTTWMGSQTFKRPKPTRVKVTYNPEIMGGWPCIEGTRVPAATVYAYLRESPEAAEEIYQDYPYLPYGSLEAGQNWAKDHWQSWLKQCADDRSPL